MRKIVSRFVVCGAIAASAFGLSVLPYVIAQEATKPSAKTDKGDVNEKKQSTDRLPRNYGKIGLTEAQRKSIYEVVGRYETQIDELEKKIAELKAKEVSECEAILNQNQRQSLQDLNAEAKKKAASKKKDSAKDEVKKSESKTEDSDKK
ncbi:MAG: hypothetical protein NT013_07280 [Planctomycetia bacterium]|nr:hypothetical protein [Planctomycetia bacterium]